MVKSVFIRFIRTHLCVRSAMFELRVFNYESELTKADAIKSGGYGNTGEMELRCFLGEKFQLRMNSAIVHKG